MEISWQLDNVTQFPHTADKQLIATPKGGRDPLMGCWADGCDLALIGCSQAWEGVWWWVALAHSPAAGLPPFPSLGSFAALSTLWVGRFNSVSGCVSYGGFCVCEMLSRLLSIAGSLPSQLSVGAGRQWRLLEVQWRWLAGSLVPSG